MKEKDRVWEVLRLLVGVGMVVGFGWMLWKQTLEPALEKTGKEKGVRLKAQEKFLEWSHERHMERRKKEILEEEKRLREEQSRKPAETPPSEGGSK